MSDAGDGGGEGGGGFRLLHKFDSRELLGARWWQQQVALSLATGSSAADRGSPDGRLASGDDVTRRDALNRFLLIGGAVALGGVGLFSVGTCSSPSPSRPVLAPALDLQRRRGWAIDAGSQALVYADAVPGDLDVDGKQVRGSSLIGLARRLRPAPDYAPYYSATLFQSIEGPDQGSLLNGIRPICSPAMRRAFAAGEAVAELFAGVGGPRDAALVVDLPGAESVAFAAGAARAFAPVFGFDNWPHPSGVVPSHLALAACAYYEPRLVDAGKTPPLPPQFVLDRLRLQPYANEPDRFDNRYLAVLPDADALRRLGIARVMYVVPPGIDAELDDLNDAFGKLRAAGIEVRLLSLAQFAPAPDPAQPPTPAGAPSQGQPATNPSTTVVRHYYYGSPWGSSWFWLHYPWYRPSVVGAAPPPAPAPPVGARFTPSTRRTMFRDGSGSSLGLVRDRAREQAQSRPSSSGGSWGRSGGSSFS